MARSATDQLFRVFGFILLGLVILAVLIAAPPTLRRWRFEAVQREATRPHDRALSDAGGMEGLAAEAYRSLRPPLQSHEEVIGFISMPSFGPWHVFSIQLRPNDQAARAKIVKVELVEISSGSHPQSGSYPQLASKISDTQMFEIPRTAFLAASEHLHTITSHWGEGEDDDCFDGEPVAFEQVRSGQVTSGGGNASCDEHYAEVEQVLTSLRKTYGPKP